MFNNKIYISTNISDNKDIALVNIPAGMNIADVDVKQMRGELNQHKMELRHLEKEQHHLKRELIHIQKEKELYQKKKEPIIIDEKRVSEIETSLRDIEKKIIPHKDEINRISEELNKIEPPDKEPEQTVNVVQAPFKAFVPNVSEQNDAIMAVSFIFICLLVVILAFVYFKMRRQTIKSGVVYPNKNKKNNTEKNSAEFLNKATDGIEVSPDSNIDNSNEEISVNRNFNIKLGTPRSIENCIRNFLEITSDN